MKRMKRILVFCIGIAVLLMVAVIFFRAQRSNDLEGGNLKNWRAASAERRVAAAKILSATDQYSDLLVACVDKISTLPDSGEMAVRDAVSLCYTGIKLKENL